MDNSPRTAAIAANVVEAMKTREVSQNKLAETTGIPRATLIRRLNAVTSFTVAELTAIAAVLDVELIDLLTLANRDAEGMSA